MPDPFEDWLKPISSAPAGLDDWASKIPDPFPDQERRMQEARVWANQQRGAEKEFGFGLGLRLRTRDLSLPFQGAANSIARGIAGVENPEVLRVRAQEAFGKGEATDEQLARLALYEYEDARNKSLGTAAAIGQGLGHAAPVVGEALVGGQAVKGIGGAIGLGTKIAPAATTSGRMLQSAGIQAAATPLTPGLWLDESQQRAAENGGNWYDPKNVAAPMVKAAFQNAIMGHLGEGTKGLGIAKRVGLGAALMPAEQAGADAVTTLAEKMWKGAGMDEKWATKTEWGTIGQFVRGESGEGWKSLATQATLGALFAGFHGQKSDPVGNLGKAVDSLAKADVPQDLAGRVIAEAMVRPPETIKNPEVKAFVESIIDLKPVESPKTRSAEAKSEPVQSAPEAQKTAPAKPQTASQALEALFRNDAPVDPNRPPDPLPYSNIPKEAFVPEFGNRGEVAKPEKKKGLGVRKAVEPEKPAGPVRKSEDTQRPNLELEDFFSKPTETPVAKPEGPLRKNDMLEELMGMESAPPIKPKDEPIESVWARLEAAQDLRKTEGKAPDGVERRVEDLFKPAEPSKFNWETTGKTDFTEFSVRGQNFDVRLSPAADGKPGHFSFEFRDAGRETGNTGKMKGDIAAVAVFKKAGDHFVDAVNRRSPDSVVIHGEGKRGPMYEKWLNSTVKKHLPDYEVFKSGDDLGIRKKKDTPEELKDDRYKREVSEMMARHDKAEKDLYEKYQKASKGGVEQSDAYQRYHEAQRAHGFERDDLYKRYYGKKETANEPARPAEPEGFGRTMTPEERDAGQVGGGSPLADELPRMDGGMKELALANENVDAERVRNGLQPLMSRARAKFGEVWDQAMVKLGMDPNLSADLVSGLEKKMRNISPEESALLLHRRIQFSNEYERTIRQANAAAMKNDWNGFERFDNRAKELLEQMNRLDRVMRDVGTEAGRTLAFRRQLAAEDFSLTRMMGEMVRAKKGALTPEEMQKVQDQADRIQKLEERLRDFERKEAEEADVIDLQPAEQPGMIQRVKEWLGSLFPRQRPTLGAAKRGKVWDFADRMEKEAASELKAKFGSGNLFSNPMFDPSTIASLSKYTAAKIIKSGLTFADFSSQIIARFGDAVKPHLKEIWDGAQKHVEVGKMDKVDTQVELKKTKAEVMEDRAKFERKNQSVGRKLWEGTKETNNLMRAIQTAWDVSAVGRQGGPISLSSPTLVPAAVKDMVKSLRSERGYERAQQEILNRKNALDYQIAELEFTDHNADPTKQEESLMGRYVQKLPGLAASSRAFNGYLNRLRADKFDAMALNVTSTGPQRVVELKAIANYINAMTGRGKTGYKRIDDATAHLAQVFFSPRHALSRFQVLSGQPFWGAGTWKAKKMIAKEYAKYAIGMGAVYGLAKLALGDEAEIEKDSRSSDFGKIKVGKTRIDPLAGFSQSAVVSRRLLWGEMKAAGSNEVKDLRGPGHKFKDPTSIDVAGRFIRNKLSPLGGEVSDKLFPEFTPPGVGPLTDATGRKKGLTGWAIRQADKFQPLTAGDIYDAFKEHGIPRATALSLLNLLGWGTQVHERQPKAK